MFSFTFSGLMSSILFSGIGYWMFKVGKQRARFEILFIGIALMLYTYFTSGPWGDWGIGIALCVLAKVIW